MAQQETNPLHERAAAYTRDKGKDNVAHPDVQSQTTVAGGDFVTIRDTLNGQHTWGFYFEKDKDTKLLYNGEEIATYIASRINPLAPAHLESAKSLFFLIIGGVLIIGLAFVISGLY